MDNEEDVNESVENSEVDDKTPDSSNKSVYVVFAAAILLIGGGAFWAVKNLNKPETPRQVLGSETQKPNGQRALKGQKLSETNLSDQAVQIYPGEIPESAKAIMSGWTLGTKTLADGTIQADLIPVGSEAAEGDTAHTFILKTGYKLYFADLNPNDDGPTEDKNSRDDIGILVDENGVIQ